MNQLRSACLGLLILALTQASPVYAQGTAPIHSDPDRLVIGRVEQGATANAGFRIVNRSGSALRIQRMELPIPGMRVKIQQDIAPGEVAEAALSWDTSGYAGPVDTAIVFTLGHPAQKRLILPVVGEVRAPIEILPRPALYLSQFEGESGQRSLTLLNHRQRPLAVLGLEANGQHFQAHWEAVSPGREYRIVVDVPSGTPAGRYRESLTVRTDDPEDNRIHIEVNVLVKPPLFANPEVVDFGRISRETLRQQDDLVPLLTQAVAIGRQHGSMSITAAEGAPPGVVMQFEPSKGPSNTFRMDVSLEPEALVTGPLNGTITIHTDDPENPRLEIPIRGLVDD